ncbi:MAG TPA: flagellar biosynthesis protein FlhA, partial [Bryobacteraceae bacterium]|nr:flagellar biosynthesis protein FlhA [Bryobacteraceae bacterium]
SAIQYSEQTSNLNLSPQKARDILDRFVRAIGAADSPVAAITSSASRYFLRQTIEAALPNASVLSHNEIPSGVRVVSLGVIQ